jgi:mannitol/fructose-specific phosphotransferase system IIA component (Ntr-type)
MQWAGRILITSIELWATALVGATICALWLAWRSWRIGLLSRPARPTPLVPRRAPALVLLEGGSRSIRRGSDMRICDFLDEERILLTLEPGSKTDILATLARLVADQDSQIDPQHLHRELCARERESSTGVGEGIAVPHARLADLDHTVAAFARSTGGLEFESVDGKPTHLLFVLVSPAAAPGPHLKILARVSRMLVSPDFRARSLRAANETELLALFREEDDRLGHRLRVA